MANWRQDPKILEIRQRFEQEGASPEVMAALQAEVPAARRRAEVGEEFGPLRSTAIAAGSELARIWEGGRMLVADLLDDKDMRDRAEAERAERERHMTPLEEVRPIATTVGEILPSMALPGGAAGGLARRVGTAALAGGGYEGVASGGELAPTALATVMAPVGSEAGRKLGNWFLGPGVRTVEGPDLSGSPAHQRMIQEGKDLGITYTPAQTSGNPVLEQVEASLKRSQYMSKPFFEAEEENLKLANRMAREAIGLKGDDLITDDVLNARHAALGEQFEDLVGGDNTFEISTGFMNAVDRLRDNYMRGLKRRGRVRKDLKNLKEMARDQYMKVNDYQTLASDLADTARQAYRAGDSAGARAIYKARAALDDEFDRAFGDLDDLKELRKQWRRLRQIEESKAILRGQFRPSQFATYLRGKSEGKGRVRDTEKLARLGVIDQYIANAIANSGTPTGQAIPDFLAAPWYAKLAMLGGNQLSRGYLAHPGLAMGPGGLGYMPLAMARRYDNPRIPFTSWNLPLPVRSPVQLGTDVLQRGGRAQGIEAGQGQGLFGGLF